MNVSLLRYLPSSPYTRWFGFIMGNASVRPLITVSMYRCSAHQFSYAWSASIVMVSDPSYWLSSWVGILVRNL